jgi:hypothetical protein
MIKLERATKPQVLEGSQTIWQQSLNQAIQNYGGYDQIPKQEKEKLISHYRHDQIKEALFASSAEKCAFCEGKPAEAGNIEVEHFRPKSIYPELTFEWENFLPSCRKCNGSKLDHDTGLTPIVNPYDMDPETIFDYCDIRILPLDGNEIGENTIVVCGLNSVRLMKPRADILVSLHDFSDAIKSAIEDYRNCMTDQQRVNRIRRIAESIERIELLARPEERYSGFCKKYLEHCVPYLEAKSLVERETA